MITATNEDNMIMMARYPDDYFDLAIVDPPYGINAAKGVGKYSLKKYGKSNKQWDNETPNKEYFDELFRVSKNQIICGANYFVEYLYSTKSFVCWIKNNPAPTFAQAEYLWTSLDINGKVYDSGRQIIHQIQKEGGSIHPTQKPIGLYEWLLMNYAKEGDKIVDTYRGSASLDIACHNLGFDLWTCELDKDYFNDGNKRLKQHQNQQVINFEL